MSIEQLGQLIDESEPNACVTAMFLNKSKITFGACYALLIILTVIFVHFQLYAINEVSVRDFIIDTENNAPLQAYKMNKLAEESRKKKLPDFWQEMPGNLYLGDDMFIIYSSKSNASTISQQYGLLTHDTFKSILHFESSIIERDDWAEICLQNYSQGVQLKNAALQSNN